MSRLETLLAVADDAPGCGTRWPGWRPHPLRHMEFEPEPSPWRFGETYVALHVSLRIAQAARELGGEQGTQMQRLASAIFEDGCGTIPLKDLIEWLLHHPPPPPPPYLQDMLAAAQLLTMARLSRGALNEQLADMAANQLSYSLEQAQAALTTH